MKIITYGFEIQNNKRTRYALITMLLDKPRGNSIDNTCRFYYSNDLDKLLKIKTKLIEEDIEKENQYLDANIFDYEEMKYVKGY